MLDLIEKYGTQVPSAAILSGVPALPTFKASALFCKPSASVAPRKSLTTDPVRTAAP